MLELAADRLVLVDGGTAKEFSGSLDDYTDLILGKGQAAPTQEKPAAPKVSAKDARKAAADARERNRAIREAVKAAEADIKRLTTRRSEIDRAMFDPASATPQDAKRTMSELMQARGRIEQELEEAEARWLEASEALEAQEAA
jgi:ATP-binding cassette subfamily F protein 3